MISAIVLAAGKSVRIGKENKMLLPFGESTILGTVISSLEQSLVDEVIIVTDDNIISNQVSTAGKAKFVVNKEANKGMTTSIQCGVKTTRVIFCC